jgi:multidrug efflux pump subunit AcrB
MLALWIGGYPFGFMAIIGIMGLIGVAINDSIVVLAALQARTVAGRNDLEQVVETVIKSTRHVVATTFTTIAGFTPLILDGGQFWPPLAVAIAGGVGGATLLALVFVPAAYRWFTSAARAGRNDDKDQAKFAERSADPPALAG